MIPRSDALALLHAHHPDEHLLHHALESEAVMRGLAARLGDPEELWGLAGLLHDIDFPLTRHEPHRHGLEAMTILAGKLPEEALTAIRAHNAEHTGQMPVSRLDFALRAAESVTGLVAANALVRPDRMKGMDPKSLRKKMKDKAFAANVDRERIREYKHLGLEEDEFFRIAIDAITCIAEDVRLA